MKRIFGESEIFYFLMAIEVVPKNENRPSRTRLSDRSVPLTCLYSQVAVGGGHQPSPRARSRWVGVFRLSRSRARLRGMPGAMSEQPRGRSARDSGGTHLQTYGISVVACSAVTEGRFNRQREHATSNGCRTPSEAHPRPVVRVTNTVAARLWPPKEAN